MTKQIRSQIKLLCISAAVMAGTQMANAAWTIEEEAIGATRHIHINDSCPKKVATFVFGDNQMKPYLHLYGVDGELVTKGDGGTFQHHRGIFIGWNKIESELGSADIWHGNQGSSRVVSIDRAEVTSFGARLIATVEWHQGRKPRGEVSLLLTETRTLEITRDTLGEVIVNKRSSLKAARDLYLNGDLQHAGVHYRAPQSVFEHEGIVRYETYPEGKVRGDDLKWVRFTFPIEERWYSVLQLNAPSNPVEELSMRNYGRFGYFFKQRMKTGEELDLSYRFLLREVGARDVDLTEASHQAYKLFSGR